MGPRGDYSSAYFAGTQAGVAAFVTAVVGYSIANRLLASPLSRSSQSRIKALAASDASATSTLPYKVGLLDLVVPSRRSNKYTNLLLANDICVEKAVQAVSDTLYVYLQEDAAYATRPQQGSGYTSPEVRCYLSELYGQLWDVCYLHKNLQLDVRILYNTTMSGNPRGASMTREEVLLKPEVQVVYYRGNLATQTEKVNQQRLSSDMPALTMDCVDNDIKVALQTSFHYLEDDQSHIPHFPKVAVGGTFDRLHNGHKKLLSLAAGICQGSLTIGVTSAEMLSKKKNADQIESVEDRIGNVRHFLHSVFPHLKLNIVVLTDPFGPPVHEADFDAIVVSSETIAGAVKINDIRASKGMRPLQIVVTRRTVSSLLSSTFIRNNVPRRIGRQPPPQMIA